MYPVRGTLSRFLTHKKELTYDSANRTPGHISRVNSNSQRSMCPGVHTSTFYTSQDSPWTNKWKKKMWCIYNGILCSHKKNGIMLFATTGMDLDIIIPSEVSQTAKDKTPCQSILPHARQAGLLIALFMRLTLFLCTKQFLHHKYIIEKGLDFEFLLFYFLAM